MMIPNDHDDSKAHLKITTAILDTSVRTSAAATVHTGKGTVQIGYIFIQIVKVIHYTGYCHDKLYGCYSTFIELLLHLQTQSCPASQIAW